MSEIKEPPPAEEETAFASLVSLLAGLESSVGLTGHTEALPFVGMARSELTHGGLDAPAMLHPVAVHEIPEALATVEEGMLTLLGRTKDLRRSLSIDAALPLIRLARTAV